jgi:hypothetical protein
LMEQKKKLAFQKEMWFCLHHHPRYNRFRRLPLVSMPAVEPRPV